MIVFVLQDGPEESSINKGDQAQTRLDSTTENGLQGGSGTDAGGQKSTTENGLQGGSGTDASGQNSTSENRLQGGSGTDAGGQNSSSENGLQGGSGIGADEQNSATGDEPMEKDIGVYGDKYYYFDGAIGTETNVQTTPHSVFSRGYQVIILLCCKYLGYL